MKKEFKEVLKKNLMTADISPEVEALISSMIKNKK